jgi:hypothetical protein
MQNTQAIQIIKAVLDEAVKKGLLLNLEQCNQVLQAYTVIQNTISKPNDTGAN